MAGTSQYCNHVTTCPYKIENVNTHGYIDPLCASTACAWIKKTKEKTEPKWISDIVARKRSMTSIMSQLRVLMTCFSRFIFIKKYVLCVFFAIIE